jgi:hypothetical protein
VAKGLKDTRELFGHPRILTLLLQWFRDIPRATPQRSIPVSQSATIGISTRFGLTVSSFEERLTILERRFTEESHLRSQALASESHSREAADQELRRQLEEFAAGGIHLESIGLFWMFLGITLATASIEIDKLYKLFLNYRLCLF